MIEVSLAGTASTDDVARLAHDAEHYCYVFNTLRAIIPWTTRVRSNAADLTVIASVPDRPPTGGAPA